MTDQRARIAAFVPAETSPATESGLPGRRMATSRNGAGSASVVVRTCLRKRAKAADGSCRVLPDYASVAATASAAATASSWLNSRPSAHAG